MNHGIINLLNTEYGTSEATPSSSGVPEPFWKTSSAAAPWEPRIAFGEQHRLRTWNRVSKIKRLLIIPFGWGGGGGPLSVVSSFQFTNLWSLNPQRGWYHIQNGIRSEMEFATFSVDLASPNSLWLIFAFFAAPLTSICHRKFNWAMDGIGNFGTCRRSPWRSGWEKGWPSSWSLDINPFLFQGIPIFEDLSIV